MGPQNKLAKGLREIPSNSRVWLTDPASVDKVKDQLRMILDSRHQLRAFICIQAHIHEYTHTRVCAHIDQMCAYIDSLSLSNG